MMPVKPRPPTVAQNSSGLSVGVRVVTSPPLSWIVMAWTWAPQVPSVWWFFPWMSDPIAPPTVTNLVPGLTGTNQPSGTSHRMSSSMLVPAHAVTMPRSRSSARRPDIRVVSTTVPPAF